MAILILIMDEFLVARLVVEMTTTQFINLSLIDVETRVE